MEEEYIEVVKETIVARKSLSGGSRPVVTRNGILVSVSWHRRDSGDIEIEIRDYVRTYPEDREEKT